MHGDLLPLMPVASAGKDGAEESSEVRCPVHRVTITPSDAAELKPLQDHLGANPPSQDGKQFLRGTLTGDGRQV